MPHLVCRYQLGFRMAHIARRMLPIGMHLLQRDGEFLNGHDLFLKKVGSIYYNFIEECEKDCIQKCFDDLKSTTRYCASFYSLPPSPSFSLPFDERG